MAFVSTCSRQEHSLYCLWLVCFLSVYMYKRVLQKFVLTMFFSVSSICRVKSNLIPKSGGGLLGISCSLSVSCLQSVVSMMSPTYLFGLRLRILVYPRFLAFPSSPQDIGAMLVGSLPGTLTQARTSFLSVPIYWRLGLFSLLPGFAQIPFVNGKLELELAWIFSTPSWMWSQVVAWASCPPLCWFCFFSASRLFLLSKGFSCLLSLTTQHKPHQWRLGPSVWWLKHRILDLIAYRSLPFFCASLGMVMVMEGSLYGMM